MLNTPPPRLARPTDPYLEQFERLEKIQFGKLPLWVHSFRKAGIAHFAELGLPTLRDEEWKYTPLTSLAKLPFKPVVELGETGATAPAVEQFGLKEASCRRLVFVDGHFSASLSSPVLPDSVVTAGSLAQAVSRQGQPIEPHLASYARPSDSAFVALNTAFLQDGAFILIPPRVAVPEPIHLLFIASGLELGAAVQPRNLIIAGKNSQATIIESYVSMGRVPYFTNAVTELVLDEGAVVEHCKVQNEAPEAFHLATIQAHQAPKSRFLSHSFSAGARLARNDIRSVLAGAGAYCLFNGLYLAKGGQLVDHHTVIDHAQPQGESHEFYHGILDGQATGVFNGKIFVRPNAQKTDAKQTNRNLLLSAEASVNTKPQLEIFADDVKCTHGATVGQLDEEMIFYLRSRGIGLEPARRLLLHAFARDIINRVKVESIQSALDRLVLDWFNPHPKTEP